MKKIPVTHIRDVMRYMSFGQKKVHITPNYFKTPFLHDNIWMEEDYQKQQQQCQGSFEVSSLEGKSIWME